jgi:hypothetical protein
MRPLILAVFLCLGTLPAAAQTAPATLPEETRQALERAEMLFKFAKMFIDYLPAYEVPTILPNGDILIRRKPPAPPETTGSAPAATTPAATQKKG